MPIRPVSPDVLVREVVAAVDALPGRVRVLVDGAEAATPEVLADALVDPLRVRSRPVVRVSAWDYLRPASVRLERGREDPDAFYDDWLDTGALVREVLGAVDSGFVLPALWDADADRAHRLDRVPLSDAGVVVVDGPLLLGRGLPADLAVHLSLSPAALARRTAGDRAWTLPAYARYTDEVDPVAVADLVVRADHPDRPALQS